MKRKRTSRPSKADLYRDYRREANILDFSWKMHCREIRQQRWEKLRRYLLRWLLFAGLAFLLWLLGR